MAKQKNQTRKQKYNAYQRKWRKKNPDKWRAIQRRWYLKNREILRRNDRLAKCPPYGDEDIVRFIKNGDKKKLKIIERMINGS